MSLSTHEDIQSLLGAFALDAVDPAEADLVERHIELCVKCRAEVQEHREVAGLLGYAGQDAPAGLWDRIVTSMQEPPPALRLDRLPMTTTLSGTHRDDRDATVVALLGGDPAASPASRSGRRRASMRTRTVAVLAAAAAVVVVLLGVQVVRLGHRTANLNHEVASPTMAVVDSALSTPGARQVNLSPMGSDESLDAVVLPGGQGYLYHARLTPLSSSMTYQLWGVDHGAEVSYGILGSEPAQVVAFRAGPGVSALAVTEEVAGGAVQTTHAPVAAGGVDPPL